MTPSLPDVNWHKFNLQHFFHKNLKLLGLKTNDIKIIVLAFFQPTKIGIQFNIPIIINE